MNDFIKWIVADETPVWVALVAIVVSCCSFLALFALSLLALAAGLWPIPLMIWIILPMGVLVYAYKNREDL